MLEPIVQDYIDAAFQLDLEAFSQQVQVPVLIAAVPGLEPSFQSHQTRPLTDDETDSPLARLAKLDNKATVYELRSMRGNRLGQVTIGRSEDNDLVMAEETVSSHHAIYAPAPKTNHPTIQDQESTNGTMINSHIVVPYRTNRIFDGDVVSFGDTAFLFYSAKGLYLAMKDLLKPKGPSEG